MTVKVSSELAHGDLDWPTGPAVLSDGRRILIQGWEPVAAFNALTEVVLRGTIDFPDRAGKDDPKC